MLQLFWLQQMLDDYDTPLCDKKHYGPVLHLEGDFKVMRCTLCNQIFMEPVVSAEEPKEQRKSSRTCISACDWVTEGKMVRCLSCSYTGPLPFLSTNEEELDEDKSDVVEELYDPALDDSE